MSQNPIIAFVCEHGAAKSVVASAYFNKLASELGIGSRSVARGIHPDQELSPKVVEGLREDSLTSAESIPQKLSAADVQSAQRVIIFCELPEEFQYQTIVEQWYGIPPVSENYEKARDVILERLNQLMKDLRSHSFP